jgi:hypothetical protein
MSIDGLMGDKQAVKSSRIYLLFVLFYNFIQALNAIASQVAMLAAV